MLCIRYWYREGVAIMSAKKRSMSRTTVTIAAVLGALVLAFAKTILGMPVPLTVVAAAALAAALSLFLAASRRAAFAAAALLLLCASGAAWKAQTNIEIGDNEWYAREARAVDSALVAAGERVHRLELLSTHIGERAEEFVASEQRSSSDDSLTFRLAVFNFFERLANESKHNDALPRGMEVGIQLFDPSGARVAWAGWPQVMKKTDERLLTSGNEIIYTRQVSLYRILTHMMPVSRDGRNRIGTIVVEIPLEANYKVNNKFITGASLADEIDAGMGGVISFDYYSAAESPPRLQALSPLTCNRCPVPAGISVEGSTGARWCGIRSTPRS
jgi:hypothetical protein